jgi:hypothetical protein
MKITELAEERGIPFKEGGQHHHVQFGYVGFDCPTCSPDWQAFRLGYNLEKQFLSCWVCGFRPLISTLAEVFRTTTHEIKQLLNLVEKEYKKVNVYAGKLVLPKNLVPLMNQHKRYLRQRGFDLNELESIWRINQGIGISSYLCWRVFIPIYHKGKVVSWTTRSISDEVDKRYINASPSEEAMKIKSILYGEEFCNHSVIVCEGPTDAWNVGCGAVCTFGLGIRGKYSSLPGAGGGVSLEVSNLLEAARTEKEECQLEIDNYVIERPEEVGGHATFILG